MLFVGGPNTHTTNPRWRTAVILKEIWNCHIMATVWPIDMKFGVWWCKFILFTLSAVLSRELFKIQHGRWPQCWKPKNRDISIMLWLITAKLDWVMQKYWTVNTFASPSDGWCKACGSDVAFCQITLTTCFLWSPYVIGRPLYFCPVISFFFFLLFFSSPNLSSRRLDVYHTSTHGVALGRI